MCTFMCMNNKSATNHFECDQTGRLLRLNLWCPCTWPHLIAGPGPLQRLESPGLKSTSSAKFFPLEQSRTATPAVGMARASRLEVVPHGSGYPPTGQLLPGLDCLWWSVCMFLSTLPQATLSCGTAGVLELSSSCRVIAAFVCWCGNLHWGKSAFKCYAHFPHQCYGEWVSEG